MTDEHAARSAGLPADVVDPVCGEVFPPHLAVFRSAHGDATVHFCSVTCKERFDAAPSDFPLRIPEE